MTSLRGAVVWAVVPYVPEAPFSIYRRDDSPLELPDAAPLFAAARRAESEFRFLVRAKVRPLVVVADRLDERVPEFLALRLVRLSQLRDELRRRVTAHEEEALLPVPPERMTGLTEACAVMIAAPVRVHASAVDTTNVLGRLDANELRLVHERFVKLHKLDLVNLVRDEIARLRELRDRRRPPDQSSPR